MKTCSIASGQTSVPLPSFKSFLCFRCGMMVSGAEEEKGCELMKSDGEGKEEEAMIVLSDYI